MQSRSGECTEPSCQHHLGTRGHQETGPRQSWASAAVRPRAKAMDGLAPHPPQPRVPACGLHASASTGLVGGRRQPGASAYLLPALPAPSPTHVPCPCLVMQCQKTEGGLIPDELCPCVVHLRAGWPWHDCPLAFGLRQSQRLLGHLPWPDGKGDLAVLLGMALPRGPVPDPAAHPAHIWPHSDAEDGLWGWQQQGIAAHRASMGLSSAPRAALYKSPRQQPALPVQHSTQPAPASQITAGNHVLCQLPRKRQGSKPCAEKSPQHSYPCTPLPKRPQGVAMPSPRTSHPRAG